MEIVYRASFEKDMVKLKDTSLKKKIVAIINEIEMAVSLSEIRNLKKLTGYKHHYRIRIGDYRLGIYNDGKKIELIRFMSRKDIYKYFP